MPTELARPPRQALLVEDATPTRTLLAAALEAAGFGVVACASANEAISVFGECDPDVLIADIDLRDRPNGVELATILHARPARVSLRAFRLLPRVDRDSSSQCQR